MPKKASKSDPSRYTKPELRDKIKQEVTKGDKGGKPGQWSARKAQMVASEYEHEGGGYKQGPDKQQQNLQQWGDEHWKTSDGKKAEREGGTTRYLPEEAWNELSDKEKAATNRKKQEGSRKGKQFVANTKEAASARKTSESKKAAKAKHPAKKAAPARKTSTKKSVAAKSTAKKTAAKKSPAKKSAVKKAASKTTAKSTGRKAGAPVRGRATKAAAKKTPAKTVAKRGRSKTAAG